MRINQIKDFLKSLFPVIRVWIKYANTLEENKDIIGDLIDFIREDICKEYNLDTSLKIDLLRLENILIDIVKIFAIIDKFVISLGDKWEIIDYPVNKESKEILLEVNPEIENIERISPILQLESQNHDLEEL